MATNSNGNEIQDKPNLKFIYRSEIMIGDKPLEGTSFIGLNESFDILGSLFPLRILMVSIPATFFDSKTFLTNRMVDVEFSLFAGEMTDIPMDDPEYKYTESKLYTKKFKGYIDNEFIPLDYDEQKTLKENEETPDVAYMMRIHLLEEIQHPFITDVFNGVTNTATPIADLVVGAFMKCSDPNLSLYMDPPDNTNKIQLNTLIEPLGFLQLLDYVQYNMGMYFHGFNTFIMDKTAYILSKLGIREKDPTWVIQIPPITALNNLSMGRRANTAGNIIMVDKAGIQMNDTKHEYYSNEYTRIDEDGKVYNPSNAKESNVSLFVDNDDLVQSTYNNTNITKRFRDVNITMVDTYVDFIPTDTFQIETSDFVLEKLSLWSYRRVITPKGCTTLINLFTRT